MEGETEELKKKKIPEPHNVLSVRDWHSGSQCVMLTNSRMVIIHPEFSRGQRDGGVDVWGFS